MARTAVFLSPGADLAASVDLARRADAAGYESVWVTHGIGRDGLHVLSAYAHAAPRVGLGTGVLPIYPRHPVLLAQEALTLQEVSGGRLRLGIGVSHRPVMEGALGLDMGQPLAVAREYVAVLRQALGGRVQHTGARYQVTWQMGLPRLPSPPPVYLAGLGTGMLELAGERLDGFEIVVSVPAAVTTDRAAGREAFKIELTRYLALPFYRGMLEKSGFGAEIAAWDRASTPAAVPDRLADALGAVGDAPALGRLVGAYREAGVTLPAIRPIAFPDAPHYLPTLEAGSAF